MAILRPLSKGEFMILALITEALRLVNLLIEGVPIEQRQAQARIWFLMWWPYMTVVLKLGGVVSQAEMQDIEDMVKGKDKSATN